MKKITQKDAILCKTQKQWNAIMDKYPRLKEKLKELEFDKNYLNYLFPADLKYSFQEDPKHLKSKYRIHKAKDILKKAKRKDKHFYAEQLQAPLDDEDLTFEKLKDASEGLLPNILDFLNGVGVFGKKSKIKQLEKPKEIDWSKPGQLVESELTTAITTGFHEEDRFTGLVVKGVECVRNNHKCNTLIKSKFKLCTEPITLKNE